LSAVAPRKRVGDAERLLPSVWALTADDLAKLCHQPVDPRRVNASRRGDPILISDVEGLCRGVLASAIGRRRIPPLSPSDYDEALGFLLGEVVIIARRYDPSRRGIEFRPHLYSLLSLRVPEATRWLYGRRGQHRLAGVLDDDLDDGDGAGPGLEPAAFGDAGDRVDARRWLDAGRDLAVARMQRFHGGNGSIDVTVGDAFAARRSGRQPVGTADRPS
jgi:hypothetical protein